MIILSLHCSATC